MDLPNCYICFDSTYVDNVAYPCVDKKHALHQTCFEQFAEAVLKEGRNPACGLCNQEFKLDLQFIEKINKKNHGNKVKSTSL